jgi:hypothetical protein
MLIILIVVLVLVLGGGGGYYNGRGAGWETHTPVADCSVSY